MEGQEPTLANVIARLVCIDNIDGTQLSTSSVEYGYQAFAESIIEAGLEELIRNGRPISKALFQSIAVRESNNPAINKKKRFFSAITKYISRTAYYCYNIENGYPIYDDVLCNHLYLYIPELTPDYVSEIKEACDYRTYCDKINDYLRARNANPDNGEPITNLEFDQIIWFSYKHANADPRFK